MARKDAPEPLANQLSLEDLVQYTGFQLPELAEMRKPGGVAAGVDNAGLVTFCLTAHAHGLDPRKRQCYYIQRAGKWSFQTGIDGFASIADRSQRFGGMDPVEYHGTLEIANPKDAKHPLIVPAEAEACVWKLVGPTFVPRPFRFRVNWEEFYPGPGDQGFMWRDKPRLMLGKCARAQALRMAFPEQLGDIDLVDDQEPRKVFDVTERRQPAPERETAARAEEYNRMLGESVYAVDTRTGEVVQDPRAAAIVEQAHAAAQARDETVAQLSRAQLRERWGLLTGKARDLGVEYEPISQSVSDADALAAVEDLERRVRDAESGIVKVQEHL
jgi:hypothetical protein